MQCPQCGAENPGDAKKCASCGHETFDLAQTIDRAAVDPTLPEAQAPRTSRSVSAFDAQAEINQRYQVIRQLGEGGMGEVYLVHDRELDRDVALKLIRGELTRSSTIMERFKREIQLASKITHKNVLRVYDLGEAKGVKFLTMQYVDGEDLSSLLRRQGRLPIAQTIDILRQILEGLTAAHEQGVIHRDLKPQNVMLDREGRVSITDFGLAKSFEQVSLTEAGKVLGTPHYMSPEQVKGEPLDQRSDIYSVGIILYEMLTGTIPFSGGSAFEVMAQRLHQAPRPVSEHNPKIPLYLQKIVRRCLEVDPNLRYNSTAEILKDLETQKFRTTLGYRVRHNRRMSIVMATIAAVAVIAGIVATWRETRETRQKAAEAAHRPVSVLIADLENRTGDAVFDGTLEPVLTLALEGAPFINAYSRVQAHKVATQIQADASTLDERLARLVAVREGINVVVGGALTRAGDSFQLAWKAVDPISGSTIESGEVSAATKEQMLSAVGRAAADLRKALGDETPAAEQMAAAETFTAGSLEAAHEYAMGQDLFFRGKFEDAARHYEQAVKLDPNLGRAYAGLAASYANMGRANDAEAEYKLALSHIDRMTDREKYRTRATYYLVTHNDERAIEELNQLVTQFPADMAGLNNLALAYFYQRDMAKALDASERPIAMYPKNVVGRANAALFAMYAGKFDKAKSQAQAVLQINPNYEKAYIAIALSQVAAGDLAGATATYQRLAAISPRGESMASMGLADIALIQGKTQDAVAGLTAAADRDRAEKRIDAANRKLATVAECRASATAAEEAAKTSGHDPHALFTAARAMIAAHRDESASRIASQLDSQIEPELQMYGKLIEGEILLARGKAHDALPRFEAAKNLADSWLARFDRGRAYLDLGAFTEADADFEACLKRRGEATAVFLDDMPTYHYFAPLYYYLGRAQQGLGSPSAAESYKQFLAIRTNGDGDPLVADARRRLSK